MCRAPPRLGPLWPLQLEMLLAPPVWTPRRSSGAVTIPCQPLQSTACGVQVSLIALHNYLVSKKILQMLIFSYRPTSSSEKQAVLLLSVCYRCAMRQQ